MTTLSKDYSQTATDSTLQRTSPASGLVSLAPALDRRADNEHPETPAACAEMKGTGAAALSWDRTDIFLPHDANGEDDC